MAKTYLDLVAQVAQDLLDEANLVRSVTELNLNLVQTRTHLTADTLARDTAFEDLAAATNEAVYSLIPVGEDGVQRVLIYETVKDSAGNLSIITRTAISELTPLPTPDA